MLPAGASCSHVLIDKERVAVRVDSDHRVLLRGNALRTLALFAFWRFLAAARAASRLLACVRLLL
jgi:hypothetical protein